ncbi:hypothetical protein MMC22_005815 [Lobaria immixta]|nr:hypothetical protein [Lobaria immixta]
MLTPTSNWQAGIPYVVYERDDLSSPRQHDWNMGMHWAVPILQSIIPQDLFARIQSTLTDPNTPVPSTDTLRFFHGQTGEIINEVPHPSIHRLRRNKLRALLMEGLDVREGRQLIDVEYSEDGARVTAKFADGAADTGCLLVGSDGARSCVRTLLVGAENAKPTPIDYATVMCFGKVTRETALALRSTPYHPLFQGILHPSGFFAFVGVHDASNPDRPEDWIFMHYISFFEPSGLVSNKSTAEHITHQKQLASQFCDPVKTIYEAMPDDSTTAWYIKLQQWDPQAPGHQWDNHGGRVTLAGDAAHPMTFQRGQGLNHSIMDASQLIKAVTGHWRSDTGLTSEARASAIDAYEAEMIARGGEEIRLGEENSKMLHDWDKVRQSPVFRKGFAKNQEKQ